MKLVDSCMWIDFLGRGDNPELDEMIRTGNAAVCGTVIAEVLSGVRDEKQAAILERRFQALPYLDESARVFTRAASLYRAVRREGDAVPLSDCVIAAVCLENDTGLLSYDKHFRAFGEASLMPTGRGGREQ